MKRRGRWLWVDCGVGFPDLEMPGVDLVIPDFSYIVKNKEKLAGVVVSQGHEDQSEHYHSYYGRYPYRSGHHLS